MSRILYYNELIGRHRQCCPASLICKRIMLLLEHYFIPKCQDIIFGINRQRNFNDGNKDTQYHDTHRYWYVALRRLYTVPAKTSIFYLRLLLVNVCGPTSFQHIMRTVVDVWCCTYSEACQRVGWLENDAHWDYSQRRCNYITRETNAYCLRAS